MPGSRWIHRFCCRLTIDDEDMDPERPVRTEYKRHLDIGRARRSGYEIHLARQADAFATQQGDVMDSVQRLRQQAQAAGNLKSNEQQVVQSVAVVDDQGAPTTQQSIVIHPTEAAGIGVPHGKSKTGRTRRQRAEPRTTGSYMPCSRACPRAQLFLGPSPSFLDIVPHVCKA